MRKIPWRQKRAEPIGETLVGYESFSGGRDVLLPDGRVAQVIIVASNRADVIEVMKMLGHITVSEQHVIPTFVTSATSVKFEDEDEL